MTSVDISTNQNYCIDTEEMTMTEHEELIQARIKTFFALHEAKQNEINAVAELKRVDALLWKYIKGSNDRERRAAHEATKETNPGYIEMAEAVHQASDDLAVAEAEDWAARHRVYFMERRND